MSRRKKAPDRQCLGCGGTIFDRWKRLCDRCFAELPYERRRQIASSRQNEGLHRAIDHYRAAAEWLRERRIKLAEGN